MSQTELLKSFTRLHNDYRAQKRQGIKEPVFSRDKLPEIAHDLECWE